MQCFQIGVKRFGWDERSRKPGQVRNGRWLLGMGVASAYRDNLLVKSAARVRLDRQGVVTVETDMTDIGTGSYTILTQTAAEMMGVPLQGDRAPARLPLSGVSWLGRTVWREQFDVMRVCRLHETA